MAGCGAKQTQEVKPPVVPVIGIIDMNVAVKNHPKYKGLMALEQQGNAMVSQMEAEQLARSQQAQQLQNHPLGDDMLQIEMDELNKKFEQEYNGKLAVKQREVDEKLASKAAGISRTLTDELNAYNDQVDKEYQPQIFNLQLKLKVVQLTKEEATVLQTELEKIQTARAETMTLKQEELGQRMNELMASEKPALEQELLAYRKKLDDEFATQMAAKQMEILKRGNEQQPLMTQADPNDGKKAEQLAMKQQEIEALQGFILDDITDKAGTVAAKGGFEVILTHVVVNISAVDITTQVITECNK